jgi:hypothetical protein
MYISFTAMRTIYELCYYVVASALYIILSEEPNFFSFISLQFNGSNEAGKEKKVSRRYDLHKVSNVQH